MQPEPYPSDLSDEEWSLLAPLLVPGKQAGHPRVFEPRRIADAAFHLLRTGCQWRALPHEFPPWPTVYYHFSRWRRSGTWERVNAELRERHRAAIGRNRRLAKDYERLPRTGEMLLHAAMARLTLRRLARQAH